MTDVVWPRTVAGTDSVFARLAVATEGVVGFAHCVLHPVTWDARPACLLHDLYVDGFVRYTLVLGGAPGEPNVWTATRQDEA